MNNLNELMASRKINCNYDEQLDVILNTMKKVDLKKITDSHSLKGCSSLNKTGLGERIAEVLSDSTRLDEVLMGLDETTKYNFAKLAKEAYLKCDSIEGSGMEQLMDLGYVYPTMNQDDVVLMMPEVVKETYGKIMIQEEFQKDPVIENKEPKSGKRVPIKVVKIGRNESCPCQSGKKYKKCCGR